MGLFDIFKKKLSSGFAAGSEPIRVSEVLTPQTISFYSAGPSRRQVFGSLLGSFDLPDPGAALNAILAREEAGSTVVSPGLALPHARIPGITTIKAALGICPPGIHYSSKAEDLVRLIVLFLGPAENMRLHLAFLAQVSALFQKADVVSGVLACTTPEAVLQKIREAEK
jgi:nitrogen PTS system EIIA component